MLNEKMSEEVFDGVKVSVDVSAIKASTNGKKGKVDLFALAVKLQGDVSHWIKIPFGWKLVLDGQLQIAIGEKLASELAEYLAAETEKREIADELEKLTGEIEQHSN
ncbi:MAG TPA: hypothetical protein VH143_29920, partial [Kofleriaceae bacterium]|nr:hypothetical protein [Kofleriaceae bacterium]